MNATERNATDFVATARDDDKQDRYGMGFIVDADRICCAAVVAFSVLCGAVFVCLSQWF